MGFKTGFLGSDRERRVGSIRGSREAQMGLAAWVERKEAAALVEGERRK